MRTLATTFKNDFAKSQKLFEKFTRPALELFGFKKVISIEKGGLPLNQELDRNCGIDAGGTKDGDFMFIASRIIEIKPYGSDYDCFSLRNKRLSNTETEIEKLERKIKFGLPCPIWHVQTFVDLPLNVATVAIVLTKQLINFLTDYKAKIKTTNNGTEFKLVRWQDLKRGGVDFQTTTIKAKK